jgi:hypothetical protein
MKLALENSMTVDEVYRISREDLERLKMDRMEGGGSWGGNVVVVWISFNFRVWTRQALYL